MGGVGCEDALISQDFSRHMGCRTGASMQGSTWMRGLRSLARDESGQVSTEYLVVIAMSLIVMVGVASLGLAVAGSHERANKVLRSNTP
jgi:hypothetical protein